MVEFMLVIMANSVSSKIKILIFHKRRPFKKNNKTHFTLSCQTVLPIH